MPACKESTADLLADTASWLLHNKLEKRRLLQGLIKVFGATLQRTPPSVSHIDFTARAGASRVYQAAEKPRLEPLRVIYDVEDGGNEKRRTRGDEEAADDRDGHKRAKLAADPESQSARHHNR